jgi:hypothetical protein
MTDSITRDNSQLYQYPKELEPFKELIWCPLDLPDPPEISEERFFEWLTLRHNADAGTLAGSVAGSTGVIGFDSEDLKRTASFSNKGVYPWRLVHVMRSDFADKGWEHYPQFKEMLPELADYLENVLPVDEYFTISFLNQKPGVDAGMHTDPDIYFGLRFYLVNRSDAKIFFQKARDPSLKRLLNTREEFVVGGKEQEPVIDQRLVHLPWEEVCEEEKIYAKYPRPRFAFHLTGTHAAHGVESVPEDDDKTRVTGFIICRVKAKEYAEILKRSVEKYKDYAVWWRDPPVLD